MTDLDRVSFCDSVTCDPEDCSVLLPKSHFQITILSLNIRSINANFSGLLTLLERINITCDFIILSESWLSHSQLIPALVGYNSFNTVELNNQNDGVVVYVKDNLLNIKVTEPKMHECSCLLITMGSDFAVIAVYRPHAFRDPLNFIQSLDNLLQELNSFKNVVLVGDINIDIAQGHSPSRSFDYLDVLAHHGLFLGHTLPTHGSTCLDHANLKTIYLSKVLVIDTSVTDHFAILLALSAKKASTQPFMVKVDEERLICDISNIDFKPVYSTVDPDMATKYFIEPILSALSKNTKSVKVSPRRRPIKAWITPGLLRCMRHRDNLYRKCKNPPLMKY